jgi:hypothetical protein
MSEFKITAHVGSISGGVAMGDKAQATGVGGNIVTTNVTTPEINLADLQTLMLQVRGNLAGLPADMRPRVEEAMGMIEAESGEPKPNHSKIRAFLTSLKSICEDSADNLIASGMSIFVEKILNSGT